MRRRHRACPARLLLLRLWLRLRLWCRLWFRRWLRLFGRPQLLQREASLLRRELCAFPARELDRTLLLPII